MTPSVRPLQWSPLLATGIASVDEQHQRLLGIFNQAAAAQAAGQSREQAMSLVESLFDYTRYHFLEEAQLMRKWAVDAAHRATHLQAHERFIAFLEQVRGLADSHPAEFTVDLLAFLAQWLLHHIMGLDASMAREIRARQGASASPPPHDADDVAAQQYLVDVMGQLTDALGQRTFDLLDQRQRLLEQRQKLLDLQDLYRALLRSADVLIHSRSEAEMLDSLCGTLTRDTPFHTAWIGRPEASQVFDILALAGTGGQQVREAPPRLDGADASLMVVRAWNTRQVVVCNDTQADPALRPWHEGLGAHGWASLLAAPVERAQRTWAILTFVSARPGAFDESTVALCTRIANLLGHGLDELDRKSALQDLRDAESRRARSDALTGLPNRLALDEYLPGALARAGRRGEVVAVGVLDLDDFKPVNDRFGHAVGDVLLQQLADALRPRLRRSDFLARVGGDELVVVFEDLDPEHHAEQLGAALERLHGAVQAEFDLGDGRSAQVGMTMGLALYPRDATEPDILLRLADAAMYANKIHKLDRARWWRIGNAGDAGDERAREESFEPFGEHASSLLESLDAQILDDVARAFAPAFYEELCKRAEQARILRCLGDSEFEHLKQLQSAHLRFLLQPGTTREQIVDKAQRLGFVHALIGLSGTAMAESFGLYEDLLRANLERALISSRQRYRILRLASARLRLDVQTQLAAIDQTRAAYFALLESHAPAATCWADALPAMLRSLSELPGIRHAILFRPDEHGLLHDEAGAGAGYEQIARELAQQGLYPSLVATPGTQRTPIPVAWFSRQTQVVDAYLLDERLERWHAMARAAGWRSAAAIPIASSDSTDSVLMLFGAYPHQFSAKWARSWLELLRNRLDAQFAASLRGRDLVDASKVRGFRELLYAHRLQMWVQPIVDLHSGATVKVEALARLIDADGTVVMPAQFMPAFGEQEFNALFLQGLEQALEHLHRWREAGLDLGVTVNLSPSTLAHPDCAGWIEQALRRAQVAPGHLTLEILESEDLDRSSSDQALYAIEALGVRLALDDLGAGYGSLRRLAALPIDTVKIDQSLIRELPNDPVKIIRLLAALVRISQQFAHATVVEGLEHPGYCEAARLLGARLGQGFALARPMPAADLAQWIRDTPQAPPSSAELQTWTGALAYHWVAMHDVLHPRHPGPLHACPLTRFLQAQAVQDPRALRWHDQVHHSPYTAQIEVASDSLLQWISERVARGAGSSVPGG